MRLHNQALLKAIFTAKGNLASGHTPESKATDGVDIAPFPDGAPAAACISADFELSWAWREWETEARDSMGARGRRNVPHILALLEEFQVPITWATIGHLFLDGCSRSSDGMAHGSMPRPPHNDRWEGDWYRDDPCTDAERDPLWYAPDLIEQILDSSVAHELGTHTFSHIDFSAESSDEALVESEIQESSRAMARFGLTARSLVYPFNKMGHAYLQQLAGLGITAVRHRDGDVRLCYPVQSESGVFKIYESMNLRDPIRYDYRVKAAVFLDHAARRRAVFHLWFHPSDRREVFDNQMRALLEELAERRERRAIWIATMTEIAAYCGARSQTEVSVHRGEGELDIRVESDFDPSRYGTTELTLAVTTPESPSRVLVQEEPEQERQPTAFRFDPSHQRTLLNVDPSVQSVHLSF